VTDVPIRIDPETTARVAEVARAWVGPFLAGQRAPAALYADEVVTWHAATGATTPLGDRPSGARLREAVPDLRHEDVRLHVHADGFTLRATVVGTVSGTEHRLPVVLIATVVDGRIARFEEYADSASAAPFAAALHSEVADVHAHPADRRPDQRG
jgi:ketosteroid isomerase-like protein